MVANNYEALRPAVDNYQDPRVPEEVAFNWSEGLLMPGTKFKVEFVSTLNPVTLRDEPAKVMKLLQLDHEALEDCQNLPGFDHYFADKPDSEGMARSFCIWDSRHEAEVASKRDAHQAAVLFARTEGIDVYGYYGITKTDLVIEESGISFIKKAFMAVVDGRMVTNWTR